MEWKSERTACKKGFTQADEALYSARKLLVDLDNNAGTNRTAAFTDSETEAFLDSDRGDQLNVHLNVIARHAHLGAFRQADNASNVGRSEIELRTIVVEERSMTAAFILRQDVNLAAEFGVRMNGARLCTEPGHARFPFSEYHGAEHRRCRQPQHSPGPYGTSRYR